MILLTVTKESFKAENKSYLYLWRAFVSSIYIYKQICVLWKFELCSWDSTQTEQDRNKKQAFVKFLLQKKKVLAKQRQSDFVFFQSSKGVVYVFTRK